MYALILGSGAHRTGLNNKNNGGTFWLEQSKSIFTRRKFEEKTLQEDTSKGPHFQAPDDLDLNAAGDKSCHLAQSQDNT